MVIRVDPSASEPLFQQLVQSVKRDVATGALMAGDRLPSVRELAKELVINPNTIAKAYRALEAEGVILSRRGAGSFVAERSVVLKSQERKRRFRQAIEGALSDAVHLGLTADEVRTAFDAAVKRFRFDGEEER